MSPTFCWFGIHSWRPMDWLRDHCFWCDKTRHADLGYGDCFRGFK